MDIETTSGKIVITEDIRNSKLYQFLLSNRPPAFRQRLNIIVEANEKLSKQWRPTIPNFSELIVIDEEE